MKLLPWEGILNDLGNTCRLQSLQRGNSTFSERNLTKLELPILFRNFYYKHNCVSE